MGHVWKSLVDKKGPIINLLHNVVDAIVLEMAKNLPQNLSKPVVTVAKLATARSSVACGIWIRVSNLLVVV